MKKIIFSLLVIVSFLVAGCNENIAAEAGRQLEQCRSNSDCQSGINCLQGICGVCFFNDDCSSEFPNCENGFCRGCDRDNDCPQDYICNIAGECELFNHCNSDDECPGRELCSLENVCVQCKNDWQCLADEFCNDNNECEQFAEAEGFVPGSCQDNEDCSGNEVCEFGSCVLEEGSACDFDEECRRDSSCDSSGRCYPRCIDSDGGLNEDTAGEITYARGGEGQVLVNPDGSIRVLNDRCRGPGAVEEKICTLNGAGNVILVACSGRKRCELEGNACTNVELNAKGEPCQRDGECALGLLCEESVCREVTGPSIPNTLGQECNEHLDCNGNLQYPKVMCDLGLCRAGIGVDWRFGCAKGTQRYLDNGVCLPKETVTDLPLGSFCRDNGQCGSHICLSTEEPYGICSQARLQINEGCGEHNDCVTGTCNGGTCSIASEFGSCIQNNNCAEGLVCDSELKMCIRPNVPQLRLPNGCENVKEVFPGTYENDNINLVFVGVNKPEEVNFHNYLIPYVGYGNSRTSDIFNDGNIKVENQNQLFTVDPLVKNKGLFNVLYLDENVVGRPGRSPEGHCSRICSNRAVESCRLDNKYVFDICFAECRGSASRKSHESWQSAWEGGAVATHEFGHMFGDLFDEYTEKERRNYWKNKNCAGPEDDFNLAGENARDNWGDIEGQEEVGYYRGCSYTEDQIKPHRDSIMDNHKTTEGFGLANKRFLCYSMARVIGRADLKCVELLLAARISELREAGQNIAGKATLVPDLDINKDFSEEISEESRSPKRKMGKVSRLTNPFEDEQRLQLRLKQLEKVAKTNLIEVHIRKNKGSYTIHDVMEDVGIYIAKFEEPNPADSRLTLHFGKEEISVPYNSLTAEITEEFSDKPSVFKYSYEDVVPEDKLEYGYISLIDYEIVEKDDFAVRIPTKKSINELTGITLQEEAFTISFRCRKGICKTFS